MLWLYTKCRMLKDVNIRHLLLQKTLDALLSAGGVKDFIGITFDKAVK
jgi:hypothetical protein